MGQSRTYRSTAAVVALALCASLAAASAFAHSGGMAADGCHRDNAAGDRHWHLDGTHDAGGLCVKQNGETVRLRPPEPDPVADLEAALGLHQMRIADLEAQLHANRIEIADARGRAQSAENSIVHAERRANAANRRAAEFEAAAEQAIEDARTRVAFAESLAADAEDRARGQGPRVDRRCRKVVAEIVHAETGWLSDSVSVDEAGRAVLARACLDP